VEEVPREWQMFSKFSGCLASARD